MSDIAPFRIPEPKASEVGPALDELRDEINAWIEAVKAESLERWGREPVLLEWRHGREVYGIHDVPWADRPNRLNMPTKEWKRSNVPDGWERLVDHGNKPDALRPRLKATKDWVKEWTKKAPPTAHQVIAKLLGIQTQCFFGLRLSTFGCSALGEHGTFLVWPADMIDSFDTSEDRTDSFSDYVPEGAERVALSVYYAAKEAYEAEQEEA